MATPATIVVELEKALAEAQALAGTTPPVPGWVRHAPDLLDIDLVNYDSVVVINGVGGAKWLDPTMPGWDGLGHAIHYGDLAGGLTFSNGVADWSQKFSNPSYPFPKFGVEANGLHYLESGTDGSVTADSTACRIIDWQFTRFSFTELFMRIMVFCYPETLTNFNELGLKLSGFGGPRPGGTFAEIFELGKPTPTGWPLQAYRYDAEGDQGVTIFPNFEFKPGRWYTLEEHIKVPSALGVADGVMEFKADGVMLYARSDVNMGATAMQAFNTLAYHGGVTPPKGLLRIKTARIALSRSNWIGPAPEVT